ncbi:ABC transporter ATP-binding protein (plasmid) [Azospirillum baldaniorum]|uniref:Lipopolysaccharide transport protein B: ATP-binding component of ABC superfamily n=1 Tax=Azospirillum baldaniorum TaxID=1064539 RepID=A0A9P1JYB7_9PROT|nr:ABC transporter ATP-binding protein [Azospirillum baldaniorum]AWJ93933.1 ABC transporter ATP-binding protein [Azospirillum baldaniorum]TWA81763.1 amino acid/amide ABC transporter ATP-binding protein 1 (HAAT family) [Azospirillum brasilense]CCD02110.1 putative lipopolysaccharide transport protein B: ATP-binding component of ABC superfamily [Azospirillum baldaniorum]
MTSQSQEGLVLDGVTRAFGGVVAVDNLSLTVAPGRITGLIGPNGAGKSTVVNLITGLLRLTAGRIRLGGRDITEAEASEVARAGIARTFQTVRLLKEASVLDNVVAGFHRHERAGLAAGLLGLPSALAEGRELRRRAAAILDRFGMAGFADLPAGSLSYGHQRRVEMMRALATEPRLLLLDEPVAGMNDVEADALGRIFAELAGSGLGVLLIEHNMRFVLSLCAEIHVIDSGRLIASGTPAAVRRDPAVIAAYLGT